MSKDFDDLIIGQGLAGSAVAWTLHWAGRRVAIFDRDEAVTSSKVAAGLVTPFTGQRLVRSEAFETYWPVAVEFYRRVEAEVGCDLFQESQALRLFEDKQTRAEFLDRASPSDRQFVTTWEGHLQPHGPRHCGIVMSPAGRLRVADYVEATDAHFTAEGRCFKGDIGTDDLQSSGGGWFIPKIGVSAKNVVVCSGAARNAWFPNVPNNPARGDILTVQIPDYDIHETAHRSIWIAANEDGTQTVGATYDWDRLDNEPRADGCIELLEKLERLIPGPVEVLNHNAAVQPIMRDYRPVVGRHPEHANLYVLNGLGSKGTLLAPSMATALGGLMKDGKPIGREHAYERVISQPPRKPLTALAQELVHEAVEPGVTVIDATVGNGFDTVFLAEAVGPSGSVAGYDIQADALEATRRRLDASGLSNVTLHHASHEQIAEIEPGSIAAVMFNLGYLPRGDHEITTTAETTVAAVAAAIDVIRPGGVISILCYRGHAGGPEEYAAVASLLEHRAAEVEVATYESTPPKPSSPVLIFVRTR